MENLSKILNKGNPIRRLLQSFKQGIESGKWANDMGKSDWFKKKSQQRFLSNKIYEKGERYYRSFVSLESRSI